MIDTHIAPFLADHPNFSQGLNLLGYKGVCETIYTTLLPGLNAVSSRIRYYSFYCWLLNEFGSFESKKTESSYLLFLRKSEYLLALIHAQMNDGAGVNGIPGIDYAIKELGKGEEVIKLSTGIYKPDRKTEGTYWKYRGGILAQYYLAMLSNDMGILEAVDNHERIRNISRDGIRFISGDRLATAFAGSIGEAASSLFLNAVRDDSVSLTTLNQLKQSFYMKFMPNCEERELLRSLLLQQDLPRSGHVSFLRKQTIKLFLQYFESGATSDSDEARGFSKFLYDRYILDGQNDICTIGWYLYWLNENWQYHLSEIFVHILDMLETKYESRWVPIHFLSKELATEMANSYGLRGKTIRDLYNAAKNETVSLSKREICASAFLDLVQRVIENEGKEPDDSLYGGVFRITNNSGTFHRFMADFLERLDEDLVEYLSAFIENRIIYRHYAESMRKWSAGGGVATHKFMLENGSIRFIGKTYSSHTAPRIRTLKEFLQDLGLINVTGGLTEDGVQTLQLLAS